ncbi:MAG: hypothetical protein K6A38_09395 [Lachnospiraceae bacterium]|nr:hypothetical protein [Lachnospiraceae bacterium]
MKRRTVIKVLLLVFIVIFVVIGSCGCAKTKESSTADKKNETKNTKDDDGNETGKRKVFKYDDPDEEHDLILKKSVYEEGKLTIYFDYDGEIDKESYVRCFDKDGEEISDNKFTFKINEKKQTIEIKFKKADLISGIEFHPDEYNDISFKIRYLRSDDYAILTTYFVCDLGYEDYGDEDKYLFESEKKQIEEIKKKAAVEYEEAYEMIKGTWCSIKNDDYVFIEEDENTGSLVLEYHYLDEKDVTQTDLIYCESLGIYGENSETGALELYASTGNMTAPVYINLFENGTVLSFSYSIDDSTFEKCD